MKKPSRILAYAMAGTTAAAAAAMRSLGYAGDPIKFTDVEPWVLDTGSPLSLLVDVREGARIDYQWEERKVEPITIDLMDRPEGTAI